MDQRFTLTSNTRWRRCPHALLICVVMIAVALPLSARAQSTSTATVLRDTAVFAGGCFWSMQKAFDHVAGVVATTAGYAGGRFANPTYEQVETGKTGYAESVRVIYDPAKLSYNRLLDAYWHSIDPTDDGGTFCDRGSQYRHIVFVHDSSQRSVAEASKMTLARYFSRPIAVQITAEMPFYAAEAYHQEYYQKNPVRYELYRRGCGRDKALAKAWKRGRG